MWSYSFKTDKIKQLGKNAKDFHFQFATDGVSVSLLYEKQKKNEEPVDSSIINDEIRKGYENNLFVSERSIETRIRRKRKTRIQGMEYAVTAW